MVFVVASFKYTGAGGPLLEERDALAGRPHAAELDGSLSDRGAINEKVS